MALDLCYRWWASSWPGWETDTKNLKNGVLVRRDSFWKSPFLYAYLKTKKNILIYLYINFCLGFQLFIFEGVHPWTIKKNPQTSTHKPIPWGFLCKPSFFASRLWEAAPQGAGGDWMDSGGYFSTYFGSMGRKVSLLTIWCNFFMVNAGKYTSPMDPMR